MESEMAEESPAAASVAAARARPMEAVAEEGAVGSTTTMERVAAAKKFIEDHYRAQMKNLQERKERRLILEQQLASSQVPREEQINLIKDLERKETEYMRLKRHRICVDDFDLLTIIGKGAYGQVQLCREKSTGNIYAMKKLKKTDMLVRGQVEHVRAERNLLAEVGSHCIVKLYYFFQDAEYLYLIMEYLICRLLCDVDHRIGSGGADQIKAHPWFRGVEWDKLYEMEAAFKPQVNDELDTQNFMKFPHLNPAPERASSGASRKTMLNSKDLSFVGYTYKNFEAVKDLQRSSSFTRHSAGSPSDTEDMDSSMEPNGTHTLVHLATLWRHDLPYCFPEVPYPTPASCTHLDDMDTYEGTWLRFIQVSCPSNRWRPPS